jgi:V/A-type H+-transporting ATPase subunit C
MKEEQMSKRIKDTDYLFLSSYTHVLETTLLTRERMERMLEAPADTDAVRVLVECGYPELSVIDVDGVNAMLAAMRDRVFEDLYAYAPDPRMIDVFKIRYDYHNAKALLKAEAMGTDPERLLVNVGRYGAKELREKVRDKSDVGLSETFAHAIAEAREALGTTQDPQRSDFVLDKAYFREMEQLALDTGSEFLLGYVKAQVDIANLKSVVRVLRMKKSADYLGEVLFEGGTVSADSLLRMAQKGEKLESVYATTPYAQAAEEGQAAIAGGRLTDFERMCDNALMDYLAQAKTVPFGEQVLIGYLAARESELTAVRIIMTGRLAGLKADVIRERLREAYV